MARRALAADAVARRYCTPWNFQFLARVVPPLPVFTPGQEDIADVVESRGDNLLTLRATRPLGPREGLTIAVAWPPGVVGRPSAFREATWFAADNWPLGLPLLAVLGANLAWRTYGVDPAVGRSVRPEYAPPSELSPAEAKTGCEHATARTYACYGFRRAGSQL